MGVAPFSSHRSRLQRSSHYSQPLLTPTLLQVQFSQFSKASKTESYLSGVCLARMKMKGKDRGVRQGQFALQKPCEVARKFWSRSALEEGVPAKPMKMRSPFLESFRIRRSQDSSTTAKIKLQYNYKHQGNILTQSEHSKPFYQKPLLSNFLKFRFVLFVFFILYF